MPCLLIRHGLGADRGNRGQQNRHAADVRDRVVVELIDVQTRGTADLRDHLVGARVDAEIVDVTAAQQAAERRADLRHGESELCGLIALDLDDRLRLIDTQIRVEGRQVVAETGVVYDPLSC